jgi:hypothetical protein
MTNKSETQSLWILFKTNKRLQVVGIVFSLIYAAYLAIFYRITDSSVMSLVIAFMVFVVLLGSFIYLSARWIVPQVQGTNWLRNVYLIVGSFFFGIGLSIWLVQRQSVSIAILNTLNKFVPLLHNQPVLEYQRYFPLIGTLSLSIAVAVVLAGIIWVIGKLDKKHPVFTWVKKFVLIAYAFMIFSVTGYIFCTDSMQIGPGQQSIIFYGGTETYVSDRIASPLSFVEDIETYGGFLYGRDSDGVFTVYQSQTGFYASGLKLLQTITKINPDDFIKGSRVLLSLILAMMLTGLSLSIKKKFGFLASILFSVLPIFTYWFIGPAGYLLWFYFILFVPFFVSVYLYPLVLRQRISYKKFLIFCFLAGFLVYLRGYEYFPGLIASAAIPVVFYDLQANKRLLDIARNFLFVCLCGLAGLLAVLLVHFIQLVFFYKDLFEPLHFLTDRAIARSAGGDTNLLTPYQIFINWLYVRVFYISDRVFAIFPQWKKNFDLYNNFANFHFFAFVEAGIAIILRVFMKQKLFSGLQVQKEIHLLFNLAITMLVAMVASWSWFPALGHMAHHYHMNGIMYMIPFGITLFIFTGLLIQTLIRWLVEGLQPQQIP